MRQGRKSASKRFDGHELSIATEVESQLLTAVEVPVDCAYGDGENRERSREAGIELRAKVPVQGSNGERFEKSEFQIDLEANTCTCPAGRTTSVRPIGWRQGKDGSEVRQEAFVFAAGACAGGPLEESCFKQSPTRSRGRIVCRHPQEALLQEAREWQRDPDFDREAAAGGRASDRSHDATGRAAGPILRPPHDALPGADDGGGGQPDPDRGQGWPPPVAEISTAAPRPRQPSQGLFRRPLGPPKPPYAVPSTVSTRRTGRSGQAS